MATDRGKPSAELLAYRIGELGARMQEKFVSYDRLHNEARQRMDRHRMELEKIKWAQTWRMSVVAAVSAMVPVVLALAYLYMRGKL